MGLCGVGVFVDESAEVVASLERSRLWWMSRPDNVGIWGVKAETAVWAMRVVMGDVDPQHRL